MKKELIDLRSVMAAEGVDIYLVPTGDYHGSEYIHDYFKAREYVSGFTGSAGTLIVTQSEARLWADSRYYLQAAEELSGTGIDLMKDGEEGVPTIKAYLEESLSKLASAAGSGSDGKSGPVVAFDGKVVSCTAGREYEKLAEAVNGKVISDVDLVDRIWDSRPALTGNEIWELSLTAAGLSFEEKLLQVRSAMKELKADYQLITTLDDNAWLYNLRGSDVARTPVFFSYTLITPEDVRLYIFDDACPEDIAPPGVTIKSYFSLEEDLESLASEGKSILVNPDSASFALVNTIPGGTTLIEEKILPTTALKARKNSVEIESTKAAHINDGVAMVNFIHWIKNEMTDGDIHTEISASDYLEEERRALPGFLDLSFDTISGYAEHGAIVHYRATPETDKQLAPEGFLLMDSGGQYTTGTTDITRTIALGPLTQRMKECYTVILKGHIQLALAKFPKGTTGKDLDPIAKAPLTEYGISYSHGTGHGVGHVLCVHEAPQRINNISEVALAPGMITSDEPGYYPEGEFGIRIEGELLCVEADGGMLGDGGGMLGDGSADGGMLGDGGGMLGFEMLTCCPYERDAIIKEMLTPEEIDFVDKYHAWVHNSLIVKVDAEAQEWLTEVCKPL